MDPKTDTPTKQENSETKAILDQITALNETIGSLQTNLETIQSDVDEIKTPVKEEEVEQPKYQPKTWDDIPKTAKEIAANRGWSVLRTLSVLEQLKAAGRVRAVQVRRTCLDDVSRLRAGYVLVKR